MANLTLVRDGHHAAALALSRGETLLEGLLRQGVALAHECGGTLACATCRVVVQQGMESLSPSSEDERDMLDRAEALTPGARLSCQAVVGSGDITVEIPDGRTVPIAMVPSASALPVALSKRAARHVASQLARLSGAPGVRLSVEPAGCSGLRYRLTPVDAFRNDDTVFESCGIRIAIDPASLPHVHGTAVDIVQDGLARRVRFHNPNAKQSCGCGESFAT